MSFKLNEWNDILQYANKVCKDLNSKGYNTKPIPYVMYDGEKGLYLQVFDSEGNLFTQYATGVHTNSADMKKAIKQMANLIIAEV